MILQRDIIRYGNAELRTFRVVWIDERDVFLFDMDAKYSRFDRHLREDVLDDINNGHAEIVLGHSYDLMPNPAALSPAQTRRRDKMMRAVAPLIEQAPEIFEDRKRGRMVAALATPSAKTVHKALYRYWKNGMTANALVPSFNVCGTSPRKPGDAKLGRPRAKGFPCGVNITPDVAQIFDGAIKRLYRSNRRNSLKAAYNQMIAEKFVDVVDDGGTGRSRSVVKAEYRETGLPSYRQFTYWYSKRDDILEIRRKRVGGSRYDKDMREVVGTATKGLYGCGSRFQIDSTPLDLGCVSEINPTAYIGRPTFYQVTDTVSSMICGIYVGLENASWAAASIAVSNVVEDKVAFCARYGVKIEPEEWPVVGALPARIMADRGEFEGYDATGFTDKSSVTVETTAPYRGDQKGTGEKKFDMVHSLLKGRLDGFVEKDHAERGDDDYRLSARLTLNQVVAAVIRAVIFLNNSHKLVDRPRSRKMIADRVPAIPREIWNWSHRHGLTEMRRAGAMAAAFALLPVGDAQTTKEGYLFRGLLYLPVDGSDRDKFAFARQNGRTPVKVSWDPLRTTNIYLHDKDADCGFKVMVLSGKSEQYANVAFAEVAELKRLDAVHTAVHEIDEAEGFAELDKAFRDINKVARQNRRTKLKARDLAGTKENRKAAVGRERETREPKMPRTEVSHVTDLAEARKVATKTQDRADEGSIADMFG